MSPLTILRKIIKQGKNRIAFFLIISGFYAPFSKQYKLIEKAYDTAKDAFRFKNREDGDRYFEHLREVTLIAILYLGITDYRDIVCLLLHDIVEDIESWTLERVAREFGRKIARHLEYLTKEKIKGLSKDQLTYRYYKRFESAPRIVIIKKLCDRMHNLMKLYGCDREKQLRKINETIKYYLPLARKVMVFYWEFILMIDELQRRMKSERTVQYLLPPGSMSVKILPASK